MGHDHSGNKSAVVLSAASAEQAMRSKAWSRCCDIRLHFDVISGVQEVI